MTSAAVVMVAVFAIFATLSALEFKQMGVGLAVAVLIDATLVRAVLLPATMKLLGERELVPAQAPELAARALARGQRAGVRAGLTPSTRARRRQAARRPTAGAARA